MSETVVMVSHRCVYNHKWKVPLILNYYYTDPGQRFCKKCLEWDRIEVASIQLESCTDGARIEYTCPICFRRTIIPLFIDFTFMGMTLFLEDSLEDMFAKKTRWFHLPKRWPVMCEHSLMQ